MVNEAIFRQVVNQALETVRETNDGRTPSNAAQNSFRVTDVWNCQMTECS